MIAMHTPPDLTRRHCGLFTAAWAATAVAPARAQTATSSTPGPSPLPIFDAHLHDSHDAWERLPPATAVALLRQAGLKRAMVSSSSDEGTQMVYAAAPDLLLPVMRLVLPMARERQLFLHSHADADADAARGIRRVPRALQRRHRHLPARTLVIRGGPRQRVAAVAGHAARCGGRTHRVKKRRGAVWCRAGGALNAS